MRSVITTLVSLVIVGMLVACGQASDGQPSALRIDGSVTAQEGAGTPFAVALGIVAPAALSVTADRAAVIEVEDGYLVGTTLLAADGGFAVRIALDTVPPSDALVSAAAFLADAEGAPGCALTVSDTTARVTATTFEGVFTPSLFVYTVETGLTVSLTTTTPLGPSFEIPDDLDGRRFPVWVYADSDVSLQTTGTCAFEEALLDVDVDLSSGWTRLAYDVTVGEEPVDPADPPAITLTLRNDASTAPVFVLALDGGDDPEP